MDVLEQYLTWLLAGGCLLVLAGWLVFAARRSCTAVRMSVLPPVAVVALVLAGLAAAGAGAIATLLLIGRA